MGTCLSTGFETWTIDLRCRHRQRRLYAFNAAGLSTWTVGVKDPSVWTKAFCEQHGLKMTGKKQDLLTR